MNKQNYFLAWIMFLMVTVQMNAQQFFFSPERPSSCGASDGILTIVPTRGVPPFSYLWSTGATDVSLKNIPKGTYSATITDASGATVSHTHILNSEEFDLYLSDSKPSVFCNPTSGALTVDPVGGVGPFTYIWSNGQTSATAQGLTIGIYSVTVQDATGCLAEGEYAVGSPSFSYYPTAHIATLDEPDCVNQTNGEIAAQMSFSGYEPYTYAWNTGASNQTLTALSAGVYGVTITDALGCTASTSMTLRKKLNLTGSVVCSGSNTGTATALLVNATSPVIYKWSNNKTGPALNNLSNGPYFVTATDANGCISTGSVQVNVPSLSLNENTPKCYTGNKGVGSCWVNNDQGVSFLWDDGVASAWNNTLSPGPHGITVTTSLGCTLSSILIIPPPVAPPFTFSYTTTAADCLNGTNGALNVSVFGGISPYTFYAYGPNGFFSNDINSLKNIKAGEYALTAYTIGSTCYGQEVVTVPDAGGFEPKLMTEQLDCNTGYGAAAVLNVTTPNTQYQWSNGATSSALFNLTQGCYSVTVSAGSSCIQYYEFCLYTEDSSKTACNGLATGKLINDLGVTGCTGATGIPFQMIRTLPSGALSFTDENGVYELQLPNGSFDLETAHYAAADIACPPTGRYTVNAVQGVTVTGLDFHFYNSNPVDHRIEQRALRTAQPGYPYSARFEVCNDGSTANAGTIDLEYGNFLGSVTGISFAKHPGVISFVSETLGAPNNTATFSFPGIVPGTCELFQVDFKTPTLTAVNTPFISTAKVSPPSGDPTPDNNNTTQYSTVVGSFDPNSVLAFPARNGNPKDGGEILRNTDKSIKYQIFFQNTGNAPADLVIVRDTLDAKLDPSSIRGITASHKMKVSLEGDNQVSVFKFDNIYLPDSTSDYAGSIGSIQYEVNLKPGIAVGAQIEKQAAIFFDFNPPVITNQNVLKVVNASSVSQARPDKSLVVSPNPADAYFAFYCETAGDLSIFNAQGDLVSTQKVAEGLQQVYTTALPNGIYLIRLDAAGRVQSGKVVVAH